MAPVVPFFTAAQVRDAERPLLDAGIPLMRRAAAALAAIAAEQLTDAASRRVRVLAGSGDNGGDALYAAADRARSAHVEVVTVGSRVHEPALAAALGAGARRIARDAATEAAAGAALIVDGILGIGASADPALRGTGRDVVAGLLPIVRDRMPRIVAVDVPSGLHPDTGTADDVVLPASLTVTFGAVKAGLARGRGPQLAGDVVLVDLGLGPVLEAIPPAGEVSVSRVLVAPDAFAHEARAAVRRAAPPRGGES
ncbi:NAD(P)H-hydrate epimerase [Microbacterium sp.]|uniref:NAD(P)H-hydrate epimerase n=1 Tax=Microbacterium sp. TaxID=51671 RepID=UPI0035B12321